jgi:small basic protein
MNRRWMKMKKKKCNYASLSILSIKRGNVGYCKACIKAHIAPVVILLGVIFNSLLNCQKIFTGVIFCLCLSLQA